MTEFKAGDRVYNLSNTYSANICTLVETIHVSKRYPLGIVDSPDTFTTDGKYTTKSAIQSLVLATQENYEMLCKLFSDTPWERPPEQPTPKEVIQAMLDDGNVVLGD